MKLRRIPASCMLACAALLALPAQPVAAQAPGGRPEASSPYVLLTPGMLAGPVFSYPISGGRLRIEARNLVLGHAKASHVPTPDDALLELRGGAVTTTINGQAQQRSEGDFWYVEKGSQLDIENTGQVAVIRALYLVPAAR
jgi:hypothetical protein